MRVLITGGSGFIGSNLVEMYLRLGWEVLNIDIVSPDNDEHANCFLECNINDRTSLFKAFSSFEPDYVFHMAARTDLDGKSLEEYDTNIGGVENVCDAVCHISGIKRIIFASSMLVCRVGHSPRSYDEFSPTTIYGESKVQTELIVRNNAHRLPSFSIVRPTSIWGPGFKVPYKNFFSMVLSRTFLDLGKYSATKTYGYIGNTINQLYSLALEPNDYSNELIYLGDNTPLNISEWATLVSNTAGLPRPISMPLVVFKALAMLGDLLGYVKIRFPMTTFRLSNMTTDNILDCSLIERINRHEVISTQVAIVETVNWMSRER